MICIRSAVNIYRGKPNHKHVYRKYNGETFLVLNAIETLFSMIIFAFT